MRSNASFGVAVLLALGGCLSARPESNVREEPDSGMLGHPDSGIPEKPDSGLPENPDSGMPASGGDTGPQIICSPEGLNFGLNAVGVTYTLSIICTNAGQSDPGHPEPNLFIPAPGSPGTGLALQNGDSAFQLAFDQPFPANGLARGEDTKINVTYAPTVGGSDQDALLISSNDTSHPDISVALAGSAKELPDCNFVLNPANGLAFGHVDKGNDAVLPFEIVNNGAESCGPVSVELTPDSCPAFYFVGPSGPATSLTFPAVPGGQSAEVSVDYAPTDSQERCVATICVDLPAQPRSCFTVQGSSLSGCLLILPNPFDFGTMTFDQATGTWSASAQQTFTIRNICDTQDVNVNSISVVDPATNQGIPQPEFIVTGDPSPVTVPKVCPQYVNCPPTTPVEFQVSFAPYASGPDTAQVKIFTNDLPDPYLISLKGNAE